MFTGVSVVVLEAANKSNRVDLRVSFRLLSLVILITIRPVSKV